MLRISRSRTYGAQTPLDIARAEGSWLWTHDGRRVLDLLSSAGALSLGHNHPAVAAAVASAREAGLPTLALDFDTAPLGAFLDELDRALPAEMREDAVVHLCPPSGAVAVEAAITMAEIATGRPGLVTFEGGFHGCTRLARLASTAGGLAHHALAPVAGVTVVPYPDQVAGWPGTPQPLADEVAVKVARNALGLDSGQRRPPAALLVECVQGESGAMAASRRFLQGLRAACSEAGVVLIADEVQAGVGRTGDMWSFEWGGVCPDVLVTSKGLGGGYPVAAVVARAELDRWPPGAFTGTFRGITDGYAAAAATLRILREEELVARVRQVGDRLRRELTAATEEFDAVSRITGRGLLQGVELRPSPLGPPYALASQARQGLLDRGVLVEVGGRDHDVLRFLPPLTVTEDELALAAAALHDTLRAVTAEPLAS